MVILVKCINCKVFTVESVVLKIFQLHIDPFFIKRGFICGMIQYSLNINEPARYPDGRICHQNSDEI